ncbi:hypothetical protein ACOTTU_18800 [Roseobacter sp. EG26]|uniref:hypothetical protein n=1 Tax=Roseobacter sp. EG26 TaxID=3412477 RepID=UPI003CE48186
MKILLASLLVGTATVAVAEPIVVRSGDHEGFTRLVMQLPQSVDWQLEGAAGQQSILFSGHSDGFDTSQAFDVISRDFLTEIRTSPSRLDLELSCLCELNTFIDQGDFLVIDILDGPALPEELPSATARRVQAVPRTAFNFGDLLWSAPESSLETQNSSEIDTTAPQLSSSPSTNDENKRQQALIEETRSQLLAGVSNAASRGILQPATPNLGDLVKNSDEQEVIFDSSEQITEAAKPTPGNMRVTNSRDVPESDSDIDLMTSGATCGDPKKLAISDWGNDEAFYLQIAAQRTALYNELDKLNTDQALQLARLYLYFGFGVEAKQVLRLAEDLEANYPELLDLADIMEFGHARNPRFAHRYLDCDSDLALWALMAAKDVPVDQILNEKAALRALSKLPFHLRAFLAPIVSKRLTRYGDLEAASIALRSVQLGSATPTKQSELAKAKIETELGNNATANELLEGVIRSNTQETPEALIELVNSSVEEDSPISADVALLIESFNFELRDSDIGAELLRAHTIASAKSGQFEKAFLAMQSPEIVADKQLIAELQSHVFHELARSSDDIIFLENLFSRFPPQPQELDPKTIVATASRLHDLGFFREAERVLANGISDNHNPETSLLLAQIQLALGHPNDALVSLGDITGQDANRIRAEAYLSLGDGRTAATLFLSANDLESTSRSTWLSDDWVDLAPTHAPELSEVGALTSETVAEIPSDNRMLAVTGTALKQSALARGTLANLLNEFSVTN